MSPQKTLSARAWGELLLLSAIWGGSFLSIRIALDELGVLTTVAHRVVWAALLLWAVVLLGRQMIPRSPRIWAAFLVMGLLNNVIPFSLMAWGQLYIETGLTAILNGATAIFGVLLAALLFTDERLTPRKAAGVGLGFLGLAVTVGLDALARFDLRSLAQLAVLGGAFSYALASVWARRALAGLSPQLAAAGMLTASSLVLVPAAWMIDGPMVLTLSLRSWLAIAYYALIATAGAYLLYYRVLAMAGSGNLMLVTLLISPVAIVLGWAVLGEALTPGALAGFGLLALGMAVLDGRLLQWVRRE